MEHIPVRKHEACRVEYIQRTHWCHLKHRYHLLYYDSTFLHIYKYMCIGMCLAFGIPDSVVVVPCIFFLFWNARIVFGESVIAYRNIVFRDAVTLHFYGLCTFFHYHFGHSASQRSVGGIAREGFGRWMQIICRRRLLQSGDCIVSI